MPRKLRRDLPEFFIRTAQEQGWAAFQNGNLLRHAAENFDALVTIDQRMRYQQNVPRMNIGVVVIEVADTRLVNLRSLLSEIREAIANIALGQIVVITAL